MNLDIKIAVTSPAYLSSKDEDMFFIWLKSLKSVVRFGGEGRQLHVWVRRQPSKRDLRDMLALFYRYGMNMRQLAQFDSARHSWLRNPEAYWYRGVFGSTRAAEYQKEQKR